MRWTTLVVWCLSANVLAQAQWTQFIDQKRNVPAWNEWHREIVAKNPGVFRCRVETQAAIGVILVADRTYRALRRKDSGNMNRDDFLLSVEAPGPLFERDFTVPRAGSYWLILENQSDQDVEMGLRCMAPPTR